MKYIRLFLFFVLAPGLAFAQVNFIGAGNPIQVLNSPLHVIASDFNLDGNLDFATANYASSTISVVLGQGNLTYAAAINYNVGTNPYKIAPGDFNADGKTDLVTPNASSNNFSILLGNGNGTFMSASNYPTGSNPYGILVADFNGDAKQDIATSNYVGNSVSICLGNGNGTFGGPVNYAVGTRPQCLQAADFDNNGTLDIAVENGWSNTVNILLGNGNGTFTSGSTLATGTLPNSLAITDFNNDGEEDVITSNNSSGNASIFLGNGNGTFASAISVNGIPTPGCINVGDFNMDGNMDFVTANAYSNNLSVVTGNGNGTFASPANFAAVNNPHAATALADYNSDGWLDIAVTDYSANRIYILLGVCVSAPAQPSVINGLTTVCAGSPNTYTIPLVAGAVSYSWMLPNGWVGSSTTNTINTTAGVAGGNITVTASNACGESAQRTLAVIVNTIPVQPVNINGPTNICQNTTNTYSISAVNGAVSYTWVLPNGWSGVSNTTSIIATAGMAGGNITVTANNSCGTGPAQSQSINVNGPPPAPGAISGPSPICQGSTNTYSINPVNGATSYTWVLPNGWSGSSNTNSIIATAGANGGTISVTADNSCGSGPAQTFVVAIIPLPPAPGAISGPSPICQGSTNTYSISPVNGATSYTWTLPNGWSGSSNTTSIIATAGANGGTISVTADNACGSGVAQTLAVSVISILNTPGPISGLVVVCEGTLNSYSITPLPGAVSYTWTLPGGWSGSSVTNSINTTSGVNGGNITVTATNNCGTSPAQSIFVVVNPVYHLNSTASICQGDSIFLAGGYQKTAGNYADIFQTTNGCDSIITTALTIIQLPTVNLANQNDFCADATAFPLTGGVPAGGTYSGPGVNNNQFDPAVAGVGTHTITYSYTNPNTGCSNSTTNTIVVFPLPPVPTITVNGPVLMSSAVNGNQWYLNGTAVPGATGQSYNCLVSGAYSVCVSDINGCKSCSAVTNIITGVEESTVANEINVYPNPFRDEITISSINGEAVVSILNLFGETVYTANVIDKTLTVNLGSLPQGIYLLQVRTGKGRVVRKVVKE